MDAPTLERFLAKVEIDPVTGCWLWTGAITRPQGYGQLKIGRRAVSAHRLAHKHWVGPIPDGFDVDHVRERGCVHRHCVCPDHLEAVTHLENVGRGLHGKLADNLCRKGHPLAGENAVVERRGDGRTFRRCRLCRTMRRRTG